MRYGTFSWFRSGSLTIRILLTGFGAFPGAPRNPTAEIVARLAARRQLWARLGIALAARVLPVAYGGPAELPAGPFDIVVHLGLAGRRRRLSVETRARNRLSTLRPDASGRAGPSLRLAAGEEAARRARWPSARLVAAMAAAGAPTALSIDAGDYICNETLWLSLGGNVPLVGFIHVPSPRRSGIGVAAMTRSIEAALRLLAAEARRHRGWSRDPV